MALSQKPRLWWELGWWDVAFAGVTGLTVESSSSTAAEQRQLTGRVDRQDSPCFSGAVCGRPPTSLLTKASTLDFWGKKKKKETQGGRSRAKWHSESAAKKAWVWWNIMGNKRWKSCNNIPGHLPCWENQLAHFYNPRVWWWAKTDTVPTFMESNTPLMTVFCTSIILFQRWSQMCGVWEHPPMTAAMRAICFIHTICLLKGCILLKYVWSHFKQQLGIKTWFRIQSHVVLPMQITQTGWESSEQRVSTPG